MEGRPLLRPGGAMQDRSPSPWRAMENRLRPDGLWTFALAAMGGQGPRGRRGGRVRHSSCPRAVFLADMVWACRAEALQHAGGDNLAGRPVGICRVPT